MMNDVLMALGVEQADQHCVGGTHSGRSLWHCAMSTSP